MSDAGWLFFLVAIPAAMLVGFSKGGLPVVGMLGVPVLSLATSPVRAAALLLPIYVVTDMFGLRGALRSDDPALRPANLGVLLDAYVSLPSLELRIVASEVWSYEVAGGSAGAGAAG